VYKYLLAMVLVLSLNLFGQDNNTPTRYESLAKLQKVIGAVEQIYVDPLKLNQIVNKAIKGLMGELDAHSSFMDKKYYKEFKIQMKGEFGGLGIVVGMKDGALTVISPIDDTPAKKAGIKSGDIILKIDDKSTLKMTLNDAVSLMRGKKGTPIVLTVVRKGEQKPLKIKIIRGIIKVKSVTSKTMGDILYIRISSFDNKVAKELKAILKKHKKSKGIILDLRNNPGGSLDQAIKTVDMFVDKGIIVSQKGRDKAENKVYKAKKQTTMTKVPMVVLVNGGSASASEIVSGALQDLKRAVLIGEKTFGKGSVQVVLPLNDQNTESIKITIARYYLPSGRTIQAKGVTPDIIAYPGKVPTKENDSFSIKEKDLKKHLKVELAKVDKKKKHKKANKISKKNIITPEDLNNDNQLKVASDILKALILTHK
jgi:carboxyl-terminal processing protease